MGKRILSGAVVMVLAVAAILAGGTILAAVLFVISCTAYRELCKATGVHNKKGMDALETIWQKAAGYNLIGEKGIQFLLFMLPIGILMLMMAAYVLTFPKYRSEQVMAAFFCLIYAPVMLSFIYLTERLPYGRYIVWMIFISSWVCDTCAYFTGVTLGRHRMAPVAGSCLAGVLFAFLLAGKAIPDKNVTWAFAAIGGMGAVISQIGDLAASAIKRNHEIKDYGACIPGHGGIMDRFDSVIFTAPIIYFMAQLLIGA